MLGIGPLWFVEMLLFFDIGYTIWWAARRNRVPRRQSSNEPPSYRAIAAFILILALTSYLIRIIIIPLGRSALGFPTLSYLPQYLSFFIVGTVAVRRNWFRNIPKSMGGRALSWRWSRRSLSFPLRSPEAQISQATGTGSLRPMRCGIRPLRWECPSG